MPQIRIRRHLRRQPPPKAPQQVVPPKIIVVPGLVPEEAPNQKLTLRQKIKRDFAVPKKPKRKKTSMEEFADSADALATTMEKVEQ